MKPECIQAINSAAGKILSDSELVRLEQDIIDHYHKTPLEGLSKAQRYKLAGEKASEARIRETAALIHDKINNVYMQRDITSEIDQIQPGRYGRLQALDNKLFYKAGSSEVPLEKKIEAHNNQVLAPLAEFNEKSSKNLGFSIDKEYTRDVAKSMLGEKVDNEHARKHATLYTKTMEELHPEAIEAGMGYKYRKNRLPQLTDQIGRAHV